MKTMLIASLFVLAAQTSFASSVELCGVLESQEVVCKKAPCDPLLFLSLEDGPSLGIWAQSSSLTSKLVARVGDLVCLVGAVSENGQSMQVESISQE